MGEIRLSKLMKQFNVGLNTIVEYLNGKGAKLDMNPGAKVSDKYLPDIEKKFGEDKKAKEEAKNTDIKMKEMLEKNKKTREEDEWEGKRPPVIRNTGLSHDGAVKGEEPPTQAKPATEKSVKAPEPEKAEPVTEPLKQETVKSSTEEPKQAPQTSAPEVEGVSKPAKPESPKPVEEAAKPTDGQNQKKEDNSTDKDVSKIGVKVVGNLDLSKSEGSRGNNGNGGNNGGKKRPRTRKGGGKVDVTRVEADNNTRKPEGKSAQGRDKGGQQRSAGQGDGGRRRGRGERESKPFITQAEEEERQRQVQETVKETYNRMNEGKKNNFGAKYRKDKRDEAERKRKDAIARGEAENKVLKVTEFVTVNELATLMNVSVNAVISTCFNLGLMVSINQRLDAETIVLVAEDSGFKVEFVTAQLTQDSQDNEEDNEEDLVTRPPVITVMGHVDHGKTSLLDYIRKTNVIAGEAGGITQHIGAYNVELPSGRRITFLDTPGHEAFTAMRARGAQMTDLAIIIIAADDAVMPQTVEAISHAQAAGVPMVFAINKIDKPGAQPEKIYQQLSQMNILTEAWGGKYQCQEISAKKGINVDKLLDKVLLETDLMDLKANPSRLGSGAVIESSLDKGRGYIATVLVQNGTVHKGDVILSGSFYGRVKAMLNERGQVVKEAGPSTPVSILGLNGAPSAGEKFRVMTDEKEAKSRANQIEQLLRVQGIKTQKHMTLEEIGRRIAIGKFKELNVIVKGDVDGSVEALSDSLIKLSTEEVNVNVIHKAVGAISESDVMLASASDAIIIGFQVRPSVDARSLAEKEGIEIRLYSIIYDAINEVKDGMEGMLEPDTKEEITATAFVKQTFKISKVGTIAGCLVREGKLVKGTKVRLIRDGIVIYTGELASLRRGKDDVKEVLSGMECGLGISGYNDIKEEDIIEAFQVVEIKRKL